MLTMYRSHDRATFAHNVALVLTVRGQAPMLADTDIRAALADHFNAVDNYGLDKIRGLLVLDGAIVVIVAVPPGRSATQVAGRMKSHSSFSLLRRFPALEAKLSGRGLWQRGHGSEALGSRSVDWLRGYLTGKAIKRA